MKKAKSAYSAERASLGMTGGGPALPEISEATQSVIDICKDSASFSGIAGADFCESGKRKLCSNYLKGYIKLTMSNLVSICIF